MITDIGAALRSSAATGDESAKHLLLEAGRRHAAAEWGKFPTLHPGGARPFATNVFNRWVDHHGYDSPQDDLEMREWQWLSHFRQIGQHEMRIKGRIHESLIGPNQVQSEGVGTVESLTPMTLEAPPHLYRASRPEHADRWSWFDRFDLAKLVCDDRAGGLQIYTCDPDEIFGKVVIDRTEPYGHREVWNEWIVKPKNVRKISRWRDPFAEVKNLPAWEKRGVHALEAASIIGSWFRSTTSKVAPMDRDDGGYWLSQFQYMGQFEAHSTWDASKKNVAQQNTVEPAVELIPPKKLYRGAPDRLKNRWSWTAEPETAQWFIDMFCPDDGKIWEAEAGTVFGVINAHIENPEGGYPAEFTEWIMFPKEDTILEWHPTT